MHPYSLPAVATRLRQSARHTLRQILLFVLFGAAITAVAFNSAIDGMVLRGELSTAIAYLLVFGFLFGVPLWLAFRFLRFVLSR